MTQHDPNALNADPIKIKIRFISDSSMPKPKLSVTITHGTREINNYTLDFILCQTKSPQTDPSEKKPFKQKTFYKLKMDEARKDMKKNDRRNPQYWEELGKRIRQCLNEE